MPPRRIGVVVHPSRPLDAALGTLRTWASRHGVELVQPSAEGGKRRICEAADLQDGDVVVALGGDGTALAALRTAATVDAPVLAVACGSVGAITAVSADELDDALERLWGDDWTARPLPALAIEAAGAAELWALNDFAVVRRRSGQVVADVSVDGDLYIRLAGDGLVVATPLGSSGYTMAAGGPLLAARTPAFACTPVAMHGGSAAPLVVPADAVLTIDVYPSYAGFDVEIDGRRRTLDASSFRVTLQDAKVRLVTFSPTGGSLQRLRDRGLLADSPRVLARHHRVDRR